MSFMSPGSRSGNFIRGARQAIPGMIGGAGQLAQGLAGIFDPSGSWSQKIGGIAGGMQDMFNGPSQIDNLSSQWKNRDFGGMMGSFGNMASNIGRGLGGIGGAVGGRFGRGLQQAGNYMGMGSDLGNMAGSMYDSGRAMYGAMRDTFGNARDQFRRGDYGGFGDSMGSAMGDMSNFVGQMGRQGNRMAEMFMPRTAVMPDSSMRGNMMTPRAGSNRAVSRTSLPKQKRYAADY